MRRNKIAHRCQDHNQLCVLFSRGCAVLFGNRMCSNLWFCCLTLWMEGGYSGNRKSLECDLNFFLKWSLIKPLKSCWPENIGLRWRTFLDHERCGISRAKTLGAQNVPVNQKWRVIRLELMEIRLFYSHYVQVMRVAGCSTNLFRPQ